MPIAFDFEYKKPTALFAALELLNVYKNKAAVLAGGTDLIVYLKEDREKPELVVDIKELAELKAIEVKDNNLFIGANATFSEIIASKLVREHAPLLVEASETVASNGVRNRATLVGNICSAVPSLDSAPPLLVHDAQVVLANISGIRQVSIHDWFTGPRKTSRDVTELAIGVNIPLQKEKPGWAYVKLGRYEGEDLAQVGLGILAYPNHMFKVAHCAVAPKPSRASKTEQILNGRNPTKDILKEAQEELVQEISPIADIRSSVEYRIHMIKIMLERGLELALLRQHGKQVCRCQVLGGGL